ncbi:MAG: tRNA (adenosine(37)-N6)-threonylcarbamoyltransferase complex ATPase subunit type 1 TsaE [Microscillaceae bacterium]
MTQLQLTCRSLEELDEIAHRIITFAQGCLIWTFEGPLGAGKTTLIQHLAAQMGVEDRVQSPTFSLVNEYCQANGQPIYHFDFYRIASPSEALDLGYEEYFFSGHLCWIEWPSKISQLIPTRHLAIHLEVEPPALRRLDLQRYD